MDTYIKIGIGALVYFALGLGIYIGTFCPEEWRHGEFLKVFWSKVVNTLRRIVRIKHRRPR